MNVKSMENLLQAFSNDHDFILTEIGHEYLRWTTTANSEAIWNRLAMDGNEMNGRGNKSHTSFFSSRISLTSSAVVVSTSQKTRVVIDDLTINKFFTLDVTSLVLSNCGRSSCISHPLMIQCIGKFKFKFNCFAFTANHRTKSCTKTESWASAVNDSTKKEFNLHEK